MQNFPVGSGPWRVLRINGGLRVSRGIAPGGVRRAKLFVNFHTKEEPEVRFK